MRIYVEKYIPYCLARGRRSSERRGQQALLPDGAPGKTPRESLLHHRQPRRVSAPRHEGTFG